MPILLFASLLSECKNKRDLEKWKIGISKKNFRRPRKIRERKERDPGPFFVPICYSTSENSTGIIMEHDHRSIDRSVIGERISRRSGSRGSAFKTSFFHVLVHAGSHAIGQQHVARDFIAAEHESVSHCVRVCVCRRGKETRRLRKTLKSLERVITGIRSVCHDNGIQCAPAYTCNTSRHPFALLRLVAGSSLHMYGSRETGACDVPAENPTYPKFRDLFYRYSRNLKHPKTVGASRSIQTPSLDSTTQLQL